MLDKEDFPGIIALVDSDLYRLDTAQDIQSNTVMPDYHDLETMLLCSPALDRVLSEYGSLSKIDDFGENILDALIQRALRIGFLRLHSIRSGLGLKFDGLNYSTCIDRSTFQLSVASLIKEVKNRSQRADLSDESLETAMGDIENYEYDPREICNGTDLVEILLIGLRSRLGNAKDSPKDADPLRTALRLAYSEQDFLASTLRNSICNWEALATGFQVLKK